MKSLLVIKFLDTENVIYNTWNLVNPLYLWFRKERLWVIIIL